MTKQEIRVVPMDSTLKVWLLEKLLQEAPKTDCASQLLDAVRDVLSDKQQAILLSADPQISLAEGVLSQCLTAGELELYPKTRKVRRCGEEINLTP